MFYHFDIARILAMVAGLSIKEFAPTGEVITLTPRGKNFAESAGTHGAAIRSRIPNELYDGKVSILQGSPYNDMISARILLDAISGVGVGRLMIKDLEGTSVVSANISYFDTPPGYKAAIEPGMNEYTFVAHIKPEGIHVGSNRFLVAA